MKTSLREKLLFSGFLRRGMGLFLILTLIVLPTLLVQAVPVRAAICSDNLTVTSNLDDSSPGTLRQAILDICPGGTITFAAGLSGSTILLTSMLVISQNMTIDASGLLLPVALDGNAAQRVLYVVSGVTVNLNHLTIRNGYDHDGGAGIFNLGTLTVTNSTVSGNHTDWWGGGIYTYGTLTVTNSTLKDNSADSAGGGIWNGLYLTVANSSLSGNSVVDADSAYGGGGINNENAVLTVQNSTLSGNSATEGGGIRNTGSLWIIQNTIVANSSGADCYNSGYIYTNANNLVEDGACPDNGVNFLTGDPKLAALADNGGPTWTMALQAGSPAIDAGNDAVCVDPPVNGKDQRGVARPIGTHCDIGAYEAPVPGSFNKSSPADAATGVDPNPTLSWGTSSGATSYEYCYATSTGCTSWTSVGTDTSVGLSGLGNGQVYYWQVRAVNADGNTLANSGTYWSFSTPWHIILPLIIH